MKNSKLEVSIDMEKVADVVLKVAQLFKEFKNHEVAMALYLIASANGALSENFVAGLSKAMHEEHVNA